MRPPSITSGGTNFLSVGGVRVSLRGRTGRRRGWGEGGVPGGLRRRRWGRGVGDGTTDVHRDRSSPRPLPDIYSQRRGRRSAPSSLSCPPGGRLLSPPVEVVTRGLVSGHPSVCTGPLRFVLSDVLTGLPVSGVLVVSHDTQRHIRPLRSRLCVEDGAPPDRLCPL